MNKRDLIFISALFLATTTVAFSAVDVNTTTALLCDTKGSIYADKDLSNFLKKIPVLFTSLEVEDGQKELFLLRGNKKVKIDNGTRIIAGDVIRTGSRQKLKVFFFMPTQTMFEIQENSEVVIRNLPDDECTGVLLLKAGQIIASGAHKQKSRCDERGEIHTPNAQISPEGTKYKVSVPSRKQRKKFVKHETFEVSEGKIALRLKRLPTTARGTAPTRKYTIYSGQRARIKVNKKTKFAEIEYFTPN